MKLVAGFVFLGLAGVVTLFLITGTRRPSDTELAGSFNQHRKTYEELKRMVHADPRLRAVAEYGVQATNGLSWGSPLVAGISEERYRIYLDLMDQAGARGIIRTDDEIRFFISGSGFASKGYRIGVSWAVQSPSPLIGSLDGFRKTTNRWEHAYRSLGDGWYLWIVW